MTDLRRPISPLAVLVLVLAACGGAGGGGGNASAAPTNGTATSGPTQETASEAPATAAATPAGGGGGGGTASNACELITAAEVEGIIGGGPLKTNLLDGDPSYCTYDTGDASSVLGTALSSKGGRAVYDVYAATGTEVDGFGDEAVFDPDSKTLFIVKGDALLTLTAGAPDTETSAMLEYAKKLAAIALSRM